MLPVEPLHDLKEHINNIFKELPKHLNDEEKVLFGETMEAVLSTKEKLEVLITAFAVLYWPCTLETTAV